MADNFTPGYDFEGATGFKTSFNLNDLVTLARFTASAFLGTASSLFDGTTIKADANGNAKVADGSIGATQLTDGSITSAKLATGTGHLTGEIKIWSTNTAPSGWLEGDGSAVSRATYSDLFAVIGTTWGQGNGSTTFNLPDLRGYFLRGWDHGAGNDPDSASRTASNTGGATGDNVGSIQADQYKSHTHPINHGSKIDIGQPTVSFQQYATDIIDTVDTVANGGNETRGKNVYVMYIIKT